MQTSGKPENPNERHLYLIGLGGNLPSRHGSPVKTLVAALNALEAIDINVVARSPWFESEPVPSSDQPWFINAAACISTSIKPNNILKILHDIEIDFGRMRTVPNAARSLDLDLLMGPTVQDGGAGKSGLFDLSGNSLVLPHPRLEQRAFVLRPLAAIVPDWVHPVTGLSVAEMTARLPPVPIVRVLQG